ncbi:hypothetical protein [Pantoea sp. USMM079]|uniref:hypothetical protein n=1 Tax=Pantoea sp. USMM079 TaxID=3081675 RepID=UPI00301CC078
MKRIDTPEKEKIVQKMGMILGKLSAFLGGTVTGWLLFLPYRVLGEIIIADEIKFGLMQE